MKTEIKKRWEILAVADITSGSSKNRIEFKVKKDFICLEEIMFSAISQPGGGVPQGDVFASAAKNNFMGTLSLHMNNKKAHVIHEAVQLRAHSTLKRKYETKKLIHPLKGNSLIQGYYIDAGNSNKYPYTLNIYFRGKHKDTTTFND